MKLTLIAKLPTPDEWKAHNVSLRNGDLYLKINPDLSVKIGTEFQKIMLKNKERAEAGKDEVEIEVDIDIHYRERTPEAHRLMFALYGILAEMLNREMKDRTHKVTAEELHEKALAEWSRRDVITVSKDMVNAMIEQLRNQRFRIIGMTENENGTVSISVYVSSNYWTVKETHEHIARLINELDGMGIGRGDGVLDIVFSDFEKLKKKEGDKNDGAETALF